jgi:hypothetical protein
MELKLQTYYMFRHSGHRQVGFWGFGGKIYLLQRLVGQVGCYGGGGGFGGPRSRFYSTMRGCLHGLGMANARRCVTSWPVSTASSGFVLWMALVGWSMCGSSQGNFVGFSSVVILGQVVRMSRSRRLECVLCRCDGVAL